MPEAPRYGRRIRLLRKERGLTQAALARRLGISASYLNLIENDRRALPARILVDLARVLDVDVRTFGGEDDQRLAHDLLEAFGDAALSRHRLGRAEATDLVSAFPEVARALLDLFRAHVESRERLSHLLRRVREPDLGVDSARLSSEQVTDFVQKHRNHFPDLERAADELRVEASLGRGDLFERLAEYLERKFRVTVRIEKVSEMHGALRRYEEEHRLLRLSEVLRRGSRNFQLAHQAVRLQYRELLDELARDDCLPSEEARRLARVALANYGAAAVLMPYDPFLEAAEEVRYDLDLLGHRFRTSFEQVCHRLTTLGRRGREGIPFHMVRVDLAGNLSKKFSATGVPFPRFSGLCPLWNVHAAFLRPGSIRVQVSRLPDGTAFFSVARTVRRHGGGWKSRNVLAAIGLGCRIEDARRMVYADGIDLDHEEAFVPVGVTCRLCERLDCEARAFPPLHEKLHIDEDVLGTNFYAPVRPPPDS